MENERVQIDEKTAKLIEEMDKSLHNMEQSLGMDHPVVAKILDSYATLLRQNNLRPIDALNMEARAKKIRAKNNQAEAQKQTEGLASTVQEKHMSASQMRMVSLLLAGLLLIGFVAGGYQMYQWYGQAAAKASKQRDKSKSFKYVEVGGKNEEEPGTDPAEDPNATTTTAVDPATGSTTTTTTTTTQQVTNISVLELAERILKIKKLAKDNLVIGQDAEKEQDLRKAGDAYNEVIQQAQEMARIGKPVFTEEIAQCYEGYGRIAEANGQPDITQSCNENATEIRKRIQ